MIRGKKDDQEMGERVVYSSGMDLRGGDSSPQLYHLFPLSKLHNPCVPVLFVSQAEISLLLFIFKDCCRNQVWW